MKIEGKEWNMGDIIRFTARDCCPEPLVSGTEYEGEVITLSETWGPYVGYMGVPVSLGEPGSEKWKKHKVEWVSEESDPDLSQHQIGLMIPDWHLKDKFNEKLEEWKPKYEKWKDIISTHLLPSIEAIPIMFHAFGMTIGLTLRDTFIKYDLDRVYDDVIKFKRPDLYEDLDKL